MIDFPKHLENIQNEIDSSLRSMALDRTEPLYRMMEYQLRLIDEQGLPKPVSPDPYLHSMISVLLFTGFGGERSKIIPAALAVELAHQFMQVHTDVQDGDPKTPDKHSVWWIWGPAQAINAGDALHALSRLSLFNLTHTGFKQSVILEAIKTFDMACLTLFEGQFAEIKAQEQLTLSKSQYIEMTQRKVGALFGCAFELPVMLSGGDGASIQKSRLAGQDIGLAFQIYDEIQQIWGGQATTSPSSSLLNKKKCLPIIHAFEVGSIPVKRELADMYVKRVLTKEDIPGLQDILNRVNAREYCEEILAETMTKAITLLMEIRMEPDILNDLVDLIKARLPLFDFAKPTNEGP